MSAPDSSYRPIGDEPSVASVWLLRLVPIALFILIGVAFLNPAALRAVLPGPLGNPRLVMVLAMGSIFVLNVMSAVRQMRRRNEKRRAAFVSFAAAVGGEVTDRPYRVTPSGWEGGTRVDYRARGHAASLWQDRESPGSNRLLVEVRLRRAIQLQIVPAGIAMRFVLSKSFLLPVLSVAVKTTSTAMRTQEPGAAPMASDAVLEQMRYLADDPVATGDAAFDRAFLVKASDRDAASALVSDPSVRAAVTEMSRRSSAVQVAIERPAPGDAARLIVTARGEADPALFGAMDTALRAMLEALERTNLLERSARDVA